MKKIPKKNTPEWHQYKIAVDTVKNPMKGMFLGGPSYSEAVDILMNKFNFTLSEVKKLEGLKICKICKCDTRNQNGICDACTSFYKNDRW